MKVEGDQASVTSSPQTLEAVKEALAKQSISWETAELTMIPTSTVRLEDPAQAKQLLALLDALEEHEDIQHVYANFDIPDAILAEQAAS